MRKTYPILALITMAMVTPAIRADDAAATAISATIRARHMPFGTILDPVFTTQTGTEIQGYTRCGDSALWTGAYLAAEAFRYKVTRSPEALANVQYALAGLKSLADVTGDNRLARCIIDANSAYAAGISSEEARNTIHNAGSNIWVDNTSRDQIVGAFFGLGAAFDLVDDAAVKAGISDLATRLTGFISRHNWTPNDDLGNTFLLRPEELQMLLQVARHVNPSNPISGPFLVPPVGTGVLVDVQSNDSYFKFNLDYMTFYNLVRLQPNGDNSDAYNTVRKYTASHQNPFFNMVDRALANASPVRDAETVSLLNQWLKRSRRDFYTDVSKQVAVCGGAACQPVAVPVRPPADFLWQVSPFQLMGGLRGTIEGAGIDYILPYWMARYYGVISGSSVQSAAAPSLAVAPGSLAALYAPNLPVSPALVVTDAQGKQYGATLLFSSTMQINFLVPEAAAPGAANLAVGSQTFPFTIATVAPTLFATNGQGNGTAAALAVRVQAANPALQAPVQVFECDNTGACTPTPIQLGVDTPIYVSFYGTGIRNRSSLGNITATIHGTKVPVQYAGPAPGFVGLDQVNVLLSLTLRGAGSSDVRLTVDGQDSNTVTINVQ